MRVQREKKRPGPTRGPDACSIAVALGIGLLGMNLQDMKQVFNAGNRHLLVVVGLASRFSFACPSERKDSVGVARKLTFAVPLS